MERLMNTRHSNYHHRILLLASLLITCGGTAAAVPTDGLTAGDSAPRQMKSVTVHLKTRIDPLASFLPELVPSSSVGITGASVAQTNPTGTQWTNPSGAIGDNESSPASYTVIPGGSGLPGGLTITMNAPATSIPTGATIDGLVVTYLTYGTGHCQITTASYAMTIATTSESPGEVSGTLSGSWSNVSGGSSTDTWGFGSLSPADFNNADETVEVLCPGHNIGMGTWYIADVTLTVYYT